MIIVEGVVDTVAIVTTNDVTEEAGGMIIVEEEVVAEEDIVAVIVMTAITGVVLGLAVVLRHIAAAVLQVTAAGAVRAVLNIVEGTTMIVVTRTVDPDLGIMTGDTNVLNVDTETGGRFDRILLMLMFEADDKDKLFFLCDLKDFAVLLICGPVLCIPKPSRILQRYLF